MCMSIAMILHIAIVSTRPIRNGSLSVAKDRNPERERTGVPSYAKHGFTLGVINRYAYLFH